MDSLANPSLTYDPTLDIQGLIWIPRPTLVWPMTRSMGIHDIILDNWATLV